MKKKSTRRFGLPGKTLLTLFSLLGLVVGSQSTAQTSGCVKADFKFAVNNTSKTVKFEARTSSNALAVYWDFGDGDSAKGKNVSHKFDSAGHYKVCLTAYAYDSATNKRCSTVVCKRVVITGCSLKAGFDVKVNDLSVKLEARSNSKHAVYHWSFGDGTSARGKTAKHTYRKEHKYKICLEVKDTVTGCVTRLCKEVKVEDPCHLKVDFDLRSDGLNIKVVAKSNSKTVVYGWTFGDSSSARGREVKHAYSKAGKYTVCLIAKDTASGCVARKCVEIKVHKPCRLEVNFESSQHGSDFKFKAKSNDSTARFVWSFGDGNTATGNPVKHTYKKPGVYEVCVKAYAGKTTTGTSGCTAKKCKRVEIKKGNDCKLKADFKIVVDGKKMRVKAEANDSNLVYFWSWGDGTSGHKQTANHKYRKYGVYEVCLIVFNPRTKCKVCICKKVVIEKPCKLKADFRYSVNKSTVRFKARSNSKNVVYGWSFGDGTSKRGNPVKHTYTKTGTYKITLIAKDTVTGCVVRVSKRIIINPRARRSSLAPLPPQQQTSSTTTTTTGIEEFTAPTSDWKAQVYPVPSTSQVGFIADKDLTSVKVFNSAGNELISSALSDSKRIDISTLPTGYYFAHITATDGSVKIVKFVKN